MKRKKPRSDCTDDSSYRLLMQVLQLIERHSKEMLKLKGELERQKQLAEQQENALNEKHRFQSVTWCELGLFTYIS